MHSPFRSIWNLSVLILASLAAIASVVSARSASASSSSACVLSSSAVVESRSPLVAPSVVRVAWRSLFVVTAQAAAPPRTSSRTIAATIATRTSTPDRRVVPVMAPPPRRSSRSPTSCCSRASIAAWISPAFASTRLSSAICWASASAMFDWAALPRSDCVFAVPVAALERRLVRGVERVERRVDVLAALRLGGRPGRALGGPVEVLRLQVGEPDQLGERLLLEADAFGLGRDLCREARRSRRRASRARRPGPRAASSVVASVEAVSSSVVRVEPRSVSVVASVVRVVGQVLVERVAGIGDAADRQHGEDADDRGDPAADPARTGRPIDGRDRDRRHVDRLGVDGFIASRCAARASIGGDGALGGLGGRRRRCLRRIERVRRPASLRIAWIRPS